VFVVFGLAVVLYVRVRLWIFNLGVIEVEV